MNFSYPLAVIIEVFLTAIGVIMAFILPGYIWTYVFFPSSEEMDKDQRILLNSIERLVLGIILSVVIVTLTVFYANLLFKIPVETAVIIIDSVIISLIGLFTLSRTKPQIVERWKHFIKNSIFLRIRDYMKSFTR